VLCALGRAGLSVDAGSKPVTALREQAENQFDPELGVAVISVSIEGQ